jgi:hypothetical protein
MYHCQETSEQNTNAVASGWLVVSDNYYQDSAVEAPIRTRKTDAAKAVPLLDAPRHG